MTGPHPLLIEALERFQHAQEPDIAIRNVSWPEFATFNRCLHDLLSKRHQFASAVVVDRDVAIFAQVRRLLRSSFCAPADPDVGLTNLSDLGPCVTGELGELQTAVRTAAGALFESPHPGLEVLSNMLEGSDRLSWPKPGITRVVVPARAVAGTRRALTNLPTPDGLGWEICTLTEAKRMPSCAVTLLAGSPELHVDWRTPPEWRHRLIAWLFNAPMSPHVVAMLWSGSHPFVAEKYEPSRTSNVLDPRVVDARSYFDDKDDETTEWSERDRIIIGPGPRVPAIDFALPNGHWISFGVEHGPRPVRIDDDSEFDIDVEDNVPLKKLRRGDVLVIVEGAKNVELRRSLCADWIDRSSAEFTAAAAQAMVDDYKKAIRARSGDPVFITELRRKGLRDVYIQQQLARATDRRTIAPQQLVTFRFIAAAAGYEPPVDAWAQVQALRIGSQYAGRVINERLKEAVTKDVSWLDRIGRREMASIEIAELGTVTLAPILGIVDEIVERALSELGELVRT